MKPTQGARVACLLVTCLWGLAACLADTVFTIEDPPVDFEVVDAEPFDGIGDNGPYYTFNDALLGTEGECRSMAEFDISTFSVPPGEVISSATLEVVITEIDIAGLGVNGETPESLVVDGYVGNGLDELSDFQAGDGNTLDIEHTAEPYIGQLVSFDVTLFVADVVAAEHQYVGLTVRAGTFGGVWLEEGDGYPKLTIETIVPQLGDLNCDGAVNTFDIDPFVLALTDPAGYVEAYPNCDRDLADCDGNGSVNSFDIDPFVALLTGS